MSEESIMTARERFERLERVVLGIAAMITGEAREVTNPEEFAEWQLSLAADMKAMSDGLK